jgi:hypothetical protein
VKEVMDMRRYLLVLDTDQLGPEEEHDLEPISYLAATQQREPFETVVLSLAADDGSAGGARRAQRAAAHLASIGGQASEMISGDGLVAAVRAETRAHHYDEVILVTGRRPGSGLGRMPGRDPVHQLRREWGDRLIVFSRKRPRAGA